MMPITLDNWLAPIKREYLDTFIPDGGGAVRFVVADDATLSALRERLTAAAEEAGFQTTNRAMSSVFDAIAV